MNGPKSLFRRFFSSLFFFFRAKNGNFFLLSVTTSENKETKKRSRNTPIPLREGLDADRMPRDCAPHCARATEMTELFFTTVRLPGFVFFSNTHTLFLSKRGRSTPLPPPHHHLQNPNDFSLRILPYIHYYDDLPLAFVPSSFSPKPYYTFQNEQQRLSPFLFPVQKTCNNKKRFFSDIANEKWKETSCSRGAFFLVSLGRRRRRAGQGLAFEEVKGNGTRSRQNGFFFLFH